MDVNQQTSGGELSSSHLAPNFLNRYPSGEKREGKKGFFFFQIANQTAHACKILKNRLGECFHQCGEVFFSFPPF